MEEVSDFVHPGAPRGARVLAWITLVIIVGTMVAVIAAFFFRSNTPVGDPGELSEPVAVRPDGLKVPAITDATAEWGLDGWLTEGDNPLRGGATLHDLDGDGDLDLVVAGGTLGIYEWTGTSFRSRPAAEVGDAISVFAGDLDRDGVVDLLVGTTDGAAVVWGGSWFGPASEQLDLGASGLVTGAIPLDLGTGSPQVLVLGYGGVDAEPDLLLSFQARTVQSSVELPNSARKSMVAEIADVDDDGLADIWVGRDVGWLAGADSIYSRRGDPTGPWVDIAVELGAASAVDAMGLTLADLVGDSRLDAYISDLGDNELLERTNLGFEKVTGVGAARIRPDFAADGEISSSWASGAVDLNLDGELDLVVANGGFGELSVENKVINTTIVEDDPPAILLGLGDGTFYDVWPELGLQWRGRSRGMALGDIDGDGDTDIVVVDYQGGIHALRNEIGGSGERQPVPSTCLAAGVEVSIGGAGVLAHQQSFLGAHAPVSLPGATCAG